MLSPKGEHKSVEKAVSYTHLDVYKRQRVTSTDAAGVTSSTLVPIHVVNAETPTFEVEEKPESGKNLHFAVKMCIRDRCTRPGNVFTAAC